MRWTQLCSSFVLSANEQSHRRGRHTYPPWVRLRLRRPRRSTPAIPRGTFGYYLPLVWVRTWVQCLEYRNSAHSSLCTAQLCPHCVYLPLFVLARVRSGGAPRDRPLAPRVCAHALCGPPWRGCALPPARGLRCITLTGARQAPCARAEANVGLLLALCPCAGLLPACMLCPVYRVMSVELYKTTRILVLRVYSE